VSAPLVLRAPAKVNLSLAVLARREDGFHELDTVLMALELWDELAVEPRPVGLTLAVHGPAASGVPADDTNLVLRCARALHALATARGLRPPGLAFSLLKRIPARAGLGGGSSDAAAAALACARFFGLDPDERELRAVLDELGSDCAFFHAARATGLARCTGRGERVEPLPALDLPWSLVVVTPDFGCATAAVYRALGPLPARRAPLAFDPAALAKDTLAAARARLRNELEPAAERSHPELAAFHARLEELAPGTFRLAGSGSSWFGFCADERSAQALLARLGAADRGRRYALRGQWILPARSARADRAHSSSH
jgi:4-diphosphocytidyl-2-C-methyl-D-erythritol kinase